MYLLFPSDEDTFLLVVGSEIFGGNQLFLLEDAVEVRKIVEARLVADLRYAHGGVYQHAQGIAQADVDDVLLQAFARAELEETAERHFGHAHHVRQLAQADFFLVMLVDVVLHLLHPAAVGVLFDFGERGAGQHAGIVGEQGQFI